MIHLSGYFLLHRLMIAVLYKVKIFLRNAEAPLHWALLIYYSAKFLLTSSYFIIFTNTIEFICTVHPCN